jgi:hypothetical protein
LRTAVRHFTTIKRGPKMDKGICNEDRVGNKILNSNVEQFSGTESGCKSAQSSIEKIVWAD